MNTTEVDIDSIIERLQNADAPRRSLDIAIAETLGWRKNVDKVKDKVTGKEKEVTTWYLPNTNDIARLPNWTTSLQNAYDLAQELVPACSGGCSWEDGKGSAKLDDGPYIQAINPQIALCIAALTKYQEDRDEG